VRNSLSKCFAFLFIWNSLCIVPLPQSNNRFVSPASMSMLGPNLFRNGAGWPVPSKVTLKSELMNTIRVK
jgi:hypothetical protein